MSHFKRKKCRRQFKCIHCTPYRGLGNSRSKGMSFTGRFDGREYERERVAREEVAA